MRPFSLFEVSWEVCNKVGGINTVLSSKAHTLVDRFGDQYIAIGPWLLSDSEKQLPFEKTNDHQDFEEACRELGVPVRMGRWSIPGRPRVILVEFSQLYERKDSILAELWEDFKVDSLAGGWDYVEPVLFGWAAGMVIEKWWEHHLVPQHKRGVAQFHEWMTGSGLLYLKERAPSIGTIFTTHATILGRALSSQGFSPENGLGDQTAEELAESHQIKAKHSLEGVAARHADVFATVSAITSREAELLHQRTPTPLMPNGIDLKVMDELAGEQETESVRNLLFDIAHKFLAEDVRDAKMACTSGRYEFHNKGIDLLLDALADLENQEGQRFILFLLIPAGNSGVKGDLLERLQNGDAAEEPLSVCTHNLFEEDSDPIAAKCQERGLNNALGSRIKIIHVPVYLDGDDGLINLPYETVVKAMDLSCFPSFYEPWGYTPQESLALGVPTITSDYAGFGRWAKNEGLSEADGIYVLSRMQVNFNDAKDQLAQFLQAWLEADISLGRDYSVLRGTANRTSWRDLIENYYAAYDASLKHVQERLEQGIPFVRRPRVPLPIDGSQEDRKPRLTEFEVAATLPEKLAKLQQIAANYWWCWHREARELFEELAPQTWTQNQHNPTNFLRNVYAKDVAARAEDDAYVAKLNRVYSDFQTYMQAAGQATSTSGLESEISIEHPVAYFSAEFGIHVSLPIYSGGLGILAGDHLKSASDLNVPLVAVGLFYRMGYMAQRLTTDGEQLAEDYENTPHNLPLQPVRDPSGQRLRIKINLPSREVQLRVWRVDVGRVPLYLLDANLDSNLPEDRNITRNLYGGDHETRILQEIILGRGGARLLRKLGIEPSAYHMNEGHAAFLSLERVAHLVKKEGLTYEEARECVRANTAFTTHTPVPAGHDRFGEDLVRRYFSDVADWMGLPWEKFYALGQAEEAQDDFNMTYLALNFSTFCNGVSKLHGKVSQRLLRSFWPSLLESEIPIRTITNGIHLSTWTHPNLAHALQPDGLELTGTMMAEGAKKIDDADLWMLRQEMRQTLIRSAKQHLQKYALERHETPALVHQWLEGLTADALLIGFARRFAPYKRAHLLFKDTARLKALLSRQDRPVRILVAGKAHPRDQKGREIVRGIAEIARSEDFAGKVIFLENYNMNLARFLVQGVDVWLNNPTRLLEASGTSGMKAAANGVLNLSIGDGWWPEAFDGGNGWMIAEDRVYPDQELQDQYDSTALFHLLEQEVIPTFFERDDAGIPKRWVRMVKHCLATIPSVFNTDRMVEEYVATAYRPLAANFADLSNQRRSKVGTRVKQQHRLKKGFHHLKVLAARVSDLDNLHVGEPIGARIEMELGDLHPQDIQVEMVVGHYNGGEDLVLAQTVPLDHCKNNSHGSTQVFEGNKVMERSGSYAYGIRIRPKGEPSSQNLVRWV